MGQASGGVGDEFGCGACEVWQRLLNLQRHPGVMHSVTFEKPEDAGFGRS